MRRKTKIICGIVGVLGLLFALLLEIRNPEPLQPHLSASQAPSPSSSDEETESKPLATASGAAPAVNGSESETAPHLKTYLMEHHPAAIESRIEKRDSFISRYRLLGRKKVLLSSEETHELDDILRDREQWNTYQEYLLKTDFSSQSFADEQMYRLFLLQYFESSLAQQKDSDLLEFLISFVLKDNFGQQLSMDIKKSLAYEKVKVLGFLRQQSPESLDIIRQKMPGLRHEKLLRDFFVNPSAS